MTACTPSNEAAMASYAALVLLLVLSAVFSAEAVPPDKPKQVQCTTIMRQVLHFLVSLFYLMTVCGGFSDKISLNCETLKFLLNRT